ncbi:hypothetical protein [Microvirga sp. CF3016]|uniref:hypothetical protein n=1 Tax=Microvirga sp. CF3016 TaxID=3110181 RepID=UPI002E763390|nr:hypothetical protein [Microvirga sp. CF3016]MEE1611887.1 hypothetical protein [Microvirga sp. CF3016]
MAKAKLAVEQWQKLGEEWSAGSSVSSLSLKYNVSRKAIDNAAKRNGWIKNPIVNQALTVVRREKTEDDPRTGTENARVVHVACDRATLILQHQGQWSDIYELRQDAFRMLRGEPMRLVSNRDVLDENGVIVEKAETLSLTKRIALAHKLMAIFEADARSMMTAQEGERRAWGFDYKLQQDGNAVNESELRRRSELIDSIRTFGSKLAQLQALQGASTVEVGPRLPSQPPTIGGESA